MDEITSEAIDGLSSAVAGLLPPPPVVSLPHTIRVVPSRVTPTGLGGFVGLHREPAGEIVGRRVDARVLVSVRVDGEGDLDAAVDRVAVAVAGRDAGQARSEGLIRIGLVDIGGETSTGQGENQVRAKEMAFTALFEHLRVPTEAAETIARVPLLVDVGSTAEGGEVLYRTRFFDGALDAFETVDDASATTAAPSEWVFEPGDGSIRQLSEIRGGSTTANPNKPGAYLLLRPERQSRVVADFALGTEFRSDGRDGVGLVFRWQDADNFYFAILDERRGYRRIGRKVGGAFANLDGAAFDSGGSFTVGAVHRLRVSAQSDVFRLHFDGEPVLEGRDGALAGPGRVGFMTWANGGARFYDIDLVAL